MPQQKKKIHKRELKTQETIQVIQLGWEFQVL